MSQKPDSVTLEHARQHHVGRLLHRAARAYNILALDKLHERGHTTLSLAHTNLLPYLDIGGTRIVTLAERAGMTKQAAGQLVTELEKGGYVQRHPDPDDGRATRVQFTAAGWHYLLDAQAIKQEIEAEYRAALGQPLWEELNTALRRLVGEAPPL
ncbi:MarR family winged helix-turn-helix transcriptional regulator [Deinococcus sp. HMF7604]|uniref:MarR family winged helix-turn-helix transcriptional regulator n=1 Tax=Deinococcus betulae TaxID=2873312 RepID=UPI001CD006E1|nr:MarR family winged helix-turn-helix transcriptional regulator [Deinococcus betulae]MBZ9751097.1 MarR family winged helix-turn-helix transcriptional regulator [Deinococcus betulae]